jgi:hypothetical protein
VTERWSARDPSHRLITLRRQTPVAAIDKKRLFSS